MTDDRQPRVVATVVGKRRNADDLLGKRRSVDQHDEQLEQQDDEQAESPVTQQTEQG